MGEVYAGRKFRTEYVAQLMEADGISSIILAGRRLNDLGLTPENAGNISVRTKRGMLITVGGKNKGELTLDDVVEVVSFDGEVAKVIGSKEPSSEVPMHWMIYNKFKRVKAIIHVHDELVLAKADSLRVPQTEEFVHYGTPEQAAQVADALKRGDYIAIKNHGVVSTGVNLDAALKQVLDYHEKASL